MSNLQAAESGSTTYSTLAQRQMFEQLRCAEGVFDAIGDGLLAVTHEGRVLFCNQMARTLLGEDLPSIEPRQWREKYRFKTPEMSAPPDQRVPLLLALRGEEVTRQEMHLSGDGVRNVWLSLTARPVRDHEGRFSWAYIVLRDINLRKWSEEAMRLRDRAIAAVLEGIAITDARDPHKPIIHVNEGFERLTGYSRDEVLGRDCTFLYGTAQDDDEVREARSELRKDQAVTLELRNHRKDGSLYWCRLSITPVHDRAGVVTHFIAVVSDITELIETERKLQETTRELQAANRKIMWANKRMRRNLAAAARVQQGLLPTALPEIPGVSFAWAFEPAEELSGDFLNVIPLDDEHVALYVLDVTGHGVASAMVSVTVSRLLSPVHSATSLVYEQDPESGAYTVATAGKVATRLAMRFEPDLEAGQFFTLVYGVLNLRKGTFEYACAGHPAPLGFVGAEEFPLARTSDMPIGVGEGDYAEKTVSLAPGARLYLYSDGAIEAMNSKRQIFGIDRLRDTLRESADMTLQETIDAVMAQLSTWREGGRLNDDISLLAVEIGG